MIPHTVAVKGKHAINIPAHCGFMANMQRSSCTLWLDMANMLVEHQMFLLDAFPPYLSSAKGLAET
jgi:hypothetical protein